MENIHSRTLALIGEEAMTKLHGARVAVFGLGGVGSYIAEALARAGAVPRALRRRHRRRGWSDCTCIMYNLPVSHPASAREFP